MPKYPVLKPQEIIRILEILDLLKFVRKAPIAVQACPDGRSTTIPFHKGRDISPILLRQILNEIKIDVEDFKSLI
ncbi:hypothetical protein MASR1M45_22640 [Candidatus Kapaibacterium sp.]